MFDQVFEVECRAAAFRSGVGLVHGAGQAVQRDRCGHRAHAGALVGQRQTARLGALQNLIEPLVLGDELLRHQRRAWLAVARQKK